MSTTSPSTIAVLAPTVFVSITIEPGEAADEIHLHAGGQGIWVARMLHQLGHHPRVCAPIGGESGRALLGLIGAWGVEIAVTDAADDTPAQILDGREGQYAEMAGSRRSSLRRHEVDEYYHRFLELALDAGRCVITGPGDHDPALDDFYRRLGADLAVADVEVVADLHGRALERFLEGGRMQVLKLSAGDLVDDGCIDADAAAGPEAEQTIAEVARGYLDRGVTHVVVSRGGDPLLAWSDGSGYAVAGPPLEVVETKGSGDSMTAALAASFAEGRSFTEAIARGWAAGAANVTRQGLGSGVPELIDQLTERAIVEPRDP